MIAGNLVTIAELLSRLGDGLAKIDEAQRQVSVRVESTGEGLMNALQSVHASGAALEGMAIRQPNLDEVFLALTGHPTQDDQQTIAAPAA